MKFKNGTSEMNAKKGMSDEAEPESRIYFPLRLKSFAFFCSSFSELFFLFRQKNVLQGEPIDVAVDFER